MNAWFYAFRGAAEALVQVTGGGVFSPGQSIVDVKCAVRVTEALLSRML